MQFVRSELGIDQLTSDYPRFLGTRFDQLEELNRWSDFAISGIFEALRFWNKSYDAQDMIHKDNKHK